MGVRIRACKNGGVALAHKRADFSKSLAGIWKLAGAAPVWVVDLASRARMDGAANFAE